MGLEVSLNFMPSFFSKHLGLRYGEGYYFDPCHRAEVERAEGRFLYESLGRHGVGSPHPEPCPNLFIQPVDLVMRTQGARWRFPEDGTVESWGAPWAGLEPGRIAAIDAREASLHPVVQSVIEQYRTLEGMYGERADLFGMKGGTMNVHTPYTTAHQLCGEGLLALLIEDPEGTRIILDKVWEIYRSIFARVCEATGARPARIQLGDCAASMVSEQTYRSVIMPANSRVARSFSAAGYHSCGPSSHLLAAFAEIEGLDGIQLGPGTDIGRAAALMPGVHLQPLVDPIVMRGGTPSDVESHVSGLLDGAQGAREATLCAWSFDRDTPIRNVDRLYSVVEERRARRGGA